MPRHLRKLLFSTAIAVTLTACQPPAQKTGESQQSVSINQQEANLKQMAQNALDNGDMNAAGDFYRQMADASTGSVEGHLKAAEIYRNQGKHGEAAKLLRQAHTRQPANEEVTIALGHALTKTGNAKEAIATFDTILAKDGTHVQALSGKAVALDYQGDHAQAQELYRKIIGLNPGNVAARNNLALSYTLAGEYDRSISILETLSKAPDATKQMRQNLALAYGMKGENDKALEVLKKDMPEEKARQNLAFYDHYRGKKIPAPLSTAAAAATAAPVVAVTSEPAGASVEPVKEVAKIEPETPASQPAEATNVAVKAEAAAELAPAAGGKAPSETPPAAAEVEIKAEAPEPAKEEPVAAPASKPAADPVVTAISEVPAANSVGGVSNLTTKPMPEVPTLPVAKLEPAPDLQPKAVEEVPAPASKEPVAVVIEEKAEEKEEPVITLQKIPASALEDDAQARADAGLEEETEQAESDKPKDPFAFFKSKAEYAYPKK